jgi:hypothetical protein
MKKTFIFAAMMTALAACSTDEPQQKQSTDTRKGATITFFVDSTVIDLTTIAFTRALEAHGKSMTDLWVLDYVGSSLSQQLHQTSSDEDFGRPTLNLSVGSHHIYFIASRGQGATLSTDNHTLTFTKVLDTFYKDYEISVTATTNGSRSVTLDRIVTKLQTTITDAIPEGAATFNIIPSTWYYGIDYLTGEPTAAATDQSITINIPASEIGVSNELLNVYGFSGADEWTTNVALNCKTSGGSVLGTASLNDVPLKRNRITTYSGPLFSAEGLTTVSLSSDWLEEHTGTW